MKITVEAEKFQLKCLIRFLMINVGNSKVETTYDQLEILQILSEIFLR